MTFCSPISMPLKRKMGVSNSSISTQRRLSELSPADKKISPLLTLRLNLHTRPSNIYRSKKMRSASRRRKRRKRPQRGKDKRTCGRSKSFRSSRSDRGNRSCRDSKNRKCNKKGRPRPELSKNSARCCPRLPLKSCRNQCQCFRRLPLQRCLRSMQLIGR